jgi:hypothetical protein
VGASLKSGVHPNAQTSGVSTPWAGLREASAGAPAAVIVLALVTIVAAQDFYLAPHASALALQAWWVDASFHVVNINALSNLLAGHALPANADTGVGSGLYHFLSYVPAALACIALGLTPIQSYALVYAPLSLFLFGLGIWLLAQACWSRERALWATVVFMLLPDSLPYVASSHEFLRTKWLVSVSPGLGYGVFASALAWVLTLAGIRKARPAYVAAGWVACAAIVLVKAHLFFANALPLVVYTLAFYPGLKKTQRALLVALFLVAYAAATRVAGYFPGIPLIRLDFSNAATYAGVLAGFRPLDAISALLLRAASGLPVYLAPVGLAGALLYVHFGFLLLLGLLLLRRDAQRGQAGRWMPALAILAAYLLHAVGLAPDTRAYTYSGEPIELVHRPFVWAVAMITVCILCSLAASYPRALSAGRRWILCLLLLPASIYFYHGMQFAQHWSAPRIEYGSAYFEGLRYVEQHAARDELVQAADLDPYLAAEAASGHAPYVANYAMRLHPSADTLARSGEVERWLQETDPARIVEFAARHRIAWLLVGDAEKLRWPQAFIALHAQFRKNGVVVLRLIP